MVLLWLQVVTIVGRQADFTDTSTRITSMEVVLRLQAVTVVDRQATFTDTSTRISTIEVALWQ